MSGVKRSTLVLLILAPAIPLSVLLAKPNAMLIWPGADFSDLVTAHLPASTFVHHALGHWGQIPLWNPTILSGMPTLGDPLVGLAYAPLWLTYVFPSSAAFHALLWLHLIGAGLGAYWLAREQGISARAAGVAGVTLALSPRILGQWGLGHATLVYAFCWTPWLLWALQRAVQRSENEVGLRWHWFALAGGFLGIIASADPRWAPPAGLLAAVFAIYWLVTNTDVIPWRSGVAGGLVVLTAGLGGTAFLGIPLLTLLEFSQRASIDMTELAQTAMPAASLLQVILPNPSVWPEWGASLGAGIFVLAVLGSLTSPSARFWGAIVVGAGVLSLGPATPFWQGLVAAVPGLNLLRMPGRWFMLASLAGPIAAAFGLHALQMRADRISRRINLGVVGAGGLVIALAVVRLLALGSIESPPARAAIGSCLAATLLIVIVLNNRIQRHRILAAGAIVTIELIALGFLALEVRPIENRIPETITAELPAGYGRGRVFSPAFSYSQLEATQLQLETVEGVHPLQLRAYRIFMAGALGFSADDYSVTLPPLPASGLPTEPYLHISTDALELLGVTRIVSPYRLQLQGTTELMQDGGFWLYAVDRPRPRAWVEPLPSGQQDEWSDAVIDAWSPNRIHVTAEGPGRLVLSEIQYPNWQAYVDGLPVIIEREEGVFRSLPLTAGEHRVELRARAGFAWLGLALTTLTWLFIGVLWWRR